MTLDQSVKDVLRMRKAGGRMLMREINIIVEDDQMTNSDV